jgi:acyl dehydratase
VWDASVDTIRNFARGYGDDNPLYSDPDYAKSAPRGALVAPPLFPIAAGLPLPAGDDAIDLAPFGRGLTQTIAGDRWTMCRAITGGVRLTRERHLAEASSIPGGWELVVRTTYRAHGALYAVHDRVRHFDRTPAVHDDSVVLAHHDTSAVDRFDAGYRSERPRGAEVRPAETVSAGDEVGPLRKGPMTITDLVAYRGGVGPGPLGGEPHRLAYENRRRQPGLYDADTSGAPDITERRHYDEHYARRLGYPTAYDYSHTRLTWLSHLLTDWMGDGGWLWHLSAAMEAENYVGDAHVLTGAVTSVTIGDGFGRVDIAVEGRNQRGERTCSGTAVVLLPCAGSSAVTDSQIESMASANP